MLSVPPCSVGEALVLRPEGQELSPDQSLSSWTATEEWKRMDEIVGQERCKGRISRGGDIQSAFFKLNDSFNERQTDKQP